MTSPDLKSLIAVDLDRTLITVDSFRQLAARHSNPRVALVLAARALRLISRAACAERVCRHLAPVLADAVRMERFVDYLESQLDAEVLSMIRAHASERAVVAVVSASPQEYVGRLAARLGFVGIGSHFLPPAQRTSAGEAFVHCYGARKCELLQRRFPPEQYSYDWAVSDNRSDRPLLASFRMALLYRRGHRRAGAAAAIQP